MLGIARARARGRAALRRRRLARAAHAADRAARQRRLRRPPRRRTPRCSPTSRPTPTRLAQLLDDLLALAREDAAGPAPASRSTSPSSRCDAAGARVEVDAPAAGHGARRRGRRSSARSRNLVDNARRHGPAGGRSTISVRERRGPRARHGHATRARASTPEQAEQAFERFWRGAGGRRPRARASAWRSSGRSPSATAAASRSTGDGFTIDLPSALISQRPLKGPRG